MNEEPLIDLDSLMRYDGKDEHPDGCYVLFDQVEDLIKEASEEYKNMQVVYKSLQNAKGIISSLTADLKKLEAGTHTAVQRQEGRR